MALTAYPDDDLKQMTMKNQKTTLKIGLTKSMDFYISLIPLPLKFIPFQPLPRFLITDTVDEDTQDSTEDTLTPTSADLPTPYSIVPRSDTAKLADEKLSKVQHWLETLERPSSMTDSQYKTFM